MTPGELPITTSSAEDLKALVGKTIGPSGWLEISQEMIDAFADLSGDHQWIHVDRERAAAESPYGSTIAHGNLTLALIHQLRAQLLRHENVAIALNYGWDRVRFPAAVPAGSRIRATAETTTVDELDGGWLHIVTRFVVEREGGDKPVCVADYVIRLKFGDG